ncbi:hypothetical protein PPERSA_08580 [Pseudocohnilembus persalinus]|uniref:ceramidase n=1 Tax=Pseudocohnilembus persalinus TaxID=266149 RepID=A0A0V0R6P8_PSEPJ|nr:hypothetical protein PPERSA_08580 [Pseudocohnilembus persalinus]|eukprot:KRX10177.1 hypothetical protein PPERSA_08580 [Pseudocohnilembus persalinus]
MIKNLVFFVFLILSFNFALGIKRLPECNIDLDANHKEMWIPAFEALKNAGKTWESGFQVIFKNFNSTIFQYITDEQYAQINDGFSANFPGHYAELQGIQYAFQKYYGQYASLEYLSAWVYFHELLHVDFSKQKQAKLEALGYKDEYLEEWEYSEYIYAQGQDCTGVLVKKPDGTVMQGRSFEQSNPTGFRNIALNMTIYKGSEIVGYSTDVYWFNTGFVTAFVPGVASLQENFRYGDIQLEDLIENIQNGVWAQVFPFRRILDDRSFRTKSFKEVYQFLLDQPSPAPQFNIVGGKTDGVVLSISGIDDEQAEKPVYSLSEDAVDGWFLIQTNYDLWEKDDDQRRTIGTQTLKQMGQQLSSEKVGLFAVMDSWKIHNTNTIYTGVMDVSQNYYYFLGQDGIKQV